MLQTIDFNSFKENPQIFFKQLPEQAENEFQHLFDYFIFKYNADLKHTAINNSENNQELKKENKLLNEFAFLRLGLPNDYKFNREEANER